MPIIRDELLSDRPTSLLKISGTAHILFIRHIRSDNSDLLSCVVLRNRNERRFRFLDTDRLQLILVEFDSRKAGSAILRFVGSLQGTQITGDPSDSRYLHVVVEGQPTRQKIFSASRTVP
ncbi:hypothetical protein ANCDUO_18906 [Ancylostoma duodenale]|uniref:CLEC16A/TT9 C-terminal domain-containing protein n=1 Tax=Ancylostoma duodenale TaxID=51022 RepID=A0A0C2G1T0_9BILA|nr:hypothetical protein ANCDUO_18906 [Ancylostoma duodenale]